MKQWARLRSKKSRNEQGLFLLDGFYELREALRSPHQPLEVLFCRDFLRSEEEENFIYTLPCPATELSESAFRHLSYRENGDGWISVCKQFTHTVESLSLSEAPLFIVTENLENPGNLGAIMRSAEAAQADAVFTIGNKIDLFNPNALYASRALIFHLPVIQIENTVLLDFFKEKKIGIHATFPHSQTPYWEKDLTGGIAFVLGSESEGLTPFWNQDFSSPISIPMKGTADSLNISNTAAILLFEATRQRAVNR